MFEYRLPNIYIASFNKSGSIHMTLSLMRLLGGHRYADVVYPIGDALVGEEQRIDPSAANVLFPMQGWIFNHHTKATPNNLQILQHYSYRPVVQMRNALDCLVSVKDAYDKQDPESEKFIVPSRKGWFSWEDGQKYEWLVYNGLPYYFSFYASWRKADIPKLFIWYEEHFKDQVRSLRKVLEHTGVAKIGSFPDELLDAASRHQDGNFRVGRSGRGRELIPPHLIDVAYRSASSWGKEWEGDIVRDLLERVP